MAWTIELIRSARKDLERIDRQWQGRILDYLQSDIAELPDPRAKGKALAGELTGYWRYRIGDYRVICDIHDEVKVILVVRVAHRGRVYD